MLRAVVLFDYLCFWVIYYLLVSWCFGWYADSFCLYCIGLLVDGLNVVVVCYLLILDVCFVFGLAFRLGFGLIACVGLVVVDLCGL